MELASDKHIYYNQLGFTCFSYIFSSSLPEMHNSIAICIIAICITATCKGSKWFLSLCHSFIAAFLCEEIFFTNVATASETFKKKKKRKTDHIAIRSLFTDCFGHIKLLFLKVANEHAMCLFHDIKKTQP